MFFRFNPMNWFKKIISDNKTNINNIIMYLSYNVIYYITGLQILCNKSYKQFKPFMLFIYSFTKDPSTNNYDVKIITNGNVTLTTNKETLKNNILEKFFLQKKTFRGQYYI